MQQISKISTRKDWSKSFKKSFAQSAILIYCFLLLGFVCTKILNNEEIAKFDTLFSKIVQSRIAAPVYFHEIKEAR